MLDRFFTIFIGFRYTRAKRHNGFISFISLISMIGIALGVAVLITVLSVMNGFDYEIHKRIFNVSNQVTIADSGGSLYSWQSVLQKVSQVKDVVASAPFTMAQGMIANGGVAQGTMVSGVVPELEKNVSTITDSMVAGKITSLTPASFGIVLGQELANNLNVNIGDKIALFIPQGNISPLGMMPRYKRFTVVGIFHVGGGFGYDAGLAYINLADAQRLYQLGSAVSGIRLKVSDLYIAPKVAADIRKILPENYTVSDWTQQYSTYFKAITMEKTMMFIILLFIIAVAAFNLISSLVMVVTDKHADIAILRTLGASPKNIMTIFMVQGLFVGLLGTFMGIVGGVVLALNAPELVRIIEAVFHTHFISSSIYFIDYLPSKLDWHYVVNVSVAALIMSLLATIYPAWRAAKVQPAEALRYE